MGADALKNSEPMSEHSPTYQPPPDEGLVIRYIDDDLLVVQDIEQPVDGDFTIQLVGLKGPDR